MIGEGRIIVHTDILQRIMQALLALSDQIPLSLDLPSSIEFLFPTDTTERFQLVGVFYYRLIEAQLDIYNAMDVNHPELLHDAVGRIQDFEHYLATFRNGTMNYDLIGCLVPLMMQVFDYTWNMYHHHLPITYSLMFRGHRFTITCSSAFSGLPSRQAFRQL